MVIKFDNDIKTDFEGYQKLIDLGHKAKNSTDRIIIFDFSNVYFFLKLICVLYWELLLRF